MQITETTFLQPVVAGIVAMSGGRLGATAAALIGLVGIVIGGLALGRGRSAADIGAVGGLSRAGAALGLGATAVVLGAVFLATADGGLGTGNGLGGAVVAVALGLIAMVLGGLARARRRDVA